MHFVFVFTATMNYYCPAFFLSFISVYPLNFNKYARIKSVHQIFIFKNISHLVADNADATNPSVDIGMRSP